MPCNDCLVCKLYVENRRGHINNNCRGQTSIKCGDWNPTREVKKKILYEILSCASVDTDSDVEFVVNEIIKELG